MPHAKKFIFHRVEQRILMEIPVLIDGHRDAPGSESTFTENVSARGKCAPLGTWRAIGIRLAHWRVSLPGPGCLLPTIARRRLCHWRGVPRAERTMGCSIPKIAGPKTASG